MGQGTRQPERDGLREWRLERSLPLADQIVERLAEAIRGGELPVGTRLPSIRSLAARLGVNRNTVARAYQMLEAEGVIETRRGEGSFIAGAPPLWTLRERRRRLERALDRALVEAFHMKIPFEEVERILRARCGRLVGVNGDDHEERE